MADPKVGTGKVEKSLGISISRRVTSANSSGPFPEFLKVKRLGSLSPHETNNMANKKILRNKFIECLYLFKISLLITVYIKILH